MKTTNLPENELISWKLRQPAPRLKRRLFRDEAALPSLTWFWGALAPAAACVMLTCLGFNSSSGLAGAKSMIAMSLSNQNVAAYACGNGQVAQNHWASVTFDSTNRSLFNSSIGFTPSTNLSN